MVDLPVIFVLFGCSVIIVVAMFMHSIANTRSTVSLKQYFY